MNVLKVKKGETLARKQDKVMEWYLIQEGSVIRQFAFAEIIMHRNAIVGILENEWFACDDAVVPIKEQWNSVRRP